MVIVRLIFYVILVTVYLVMAGQLLRLRHWLATLFGLSLMSTSLLGVAGAVNLMSSTGMVHLSTVAREWMWMVAVAGAAVAGVALYIRFYWITRNNE